MQTLYDILLSKSVDNGKSLDDIDFISVGEIGLDLKYFWSLARTIEIQSINDILDGFKVVYKDGTWLNKHYNEDGSADLVYRQLPQKPNVIIVFPTVSDVMNKK